MLQNNGHEEIKYKNIKSLYYHNEEIFSYLLQIPNLIDIHENEVVIFYETTKDCYTKIDIKRILFN